jgi:hypothetical protein
MRRLLTILTVLSLAIGLTGCDAVQRKFTRKKKVTKKPRIYQLKKYDVQPSPELYQKHYSYYTSWSSEIRETLGQNHKKDVRCIEELIGQLNDMQNLLEDETADRLEKHIKEYEGVREDILKERIDRYNFAQPLITLEREDRAIKRDYCISRVRNCIKKEWTGEEAERLGVSVHPEPSPAQAASAPPAPAAPQRVHTPQGRITIREGSQSGEDAVPSDRVVKAGMQ